MKARIVRKRAPTGSITKTNYRKFLPNLAADFDLRCAYSMQHTQRAGGQKCMEIDHFNPRRKKDLIQKYKNLYLSTRHCNGAKSNRWPTGKDRALGIRFLDCCMEMDYGVHIFEDPDDHHLVGVTPEGKYHVRNCDLNAPHLVNERVERSHILSILENQIVEVKGDMFDALASAQALRIVVNGMIPVIPYLSGRELEKRRALKAALQASV